MALENGNYLTDGVNLFRFEGWLPKREGAVLEDARTDRIWSVSIDDFAAMGLKQVKPLTKGTGRVKAAR